MDDMFTTGILAEKNCINFMMFPECHESDFMLKYMGGSLYELKIGMVNGQIIHRMLEVV
jgi:hypothetical protein